jgi:hypothetical protein
MDFARFEAGLGALDAAAVHSSTRRFYEVPFYSTSQIRAERLVDRGFDSPVNGVVSQPVNDRDRYVSLWWVEDPSRARKTDPYAGEWVHQPALRGEWKTSPITMYAAFRERLRASFRLVVARPTGWATSMFESLPLSLERAVVISACGNVSDWDSLLLVNRHWHVHLLASYAVCHGIHYDTPEDPTLPICRLCHSPVTTLCDDCLTPRCGCGVPCEDYYCMLDQ